MTIIEYFEQKEYLKAAKDVDLKLIADSESKKTLLCDNVIIRNLGTDYYIPIESERHISDAERTFGECEIKDIILKTDIQTAYCEGEVKEEYLITSPILCIG